MDTDNTVMQAITVQEEEGRQELKTQFIELRAKGLSYQKIAKRLKVSKSTLANWSAELEGEIASLRAMELEALYERHYLTKESRIKLLGDQLRDIQAELKTRSLDQVSTEKLLEMELKILQALQMEHVEVRPLSDYERSVLKETS